MSLSQYFTAGEKWGAWGARKGMEGGGDDGRGEYEEWKKCDSGLGSEVGRLIQS